MHFFRKEKKQKNEPKEKGEEAKQEKKEEKQEEEQEKQQDDTSMTYPEYRSHKQHHSEIIQNNELEGEIRQKNQTMPIGDRDLAKEALRNVQETNEMAAEANRNQLHHQGQQIQNINNKLNDNQNKLGKIEYIQQNIKSGWGQFVGLFSKPEKVDEQKDQQQFKQVDNSDQPPQNDQKLDIKSLNPEDVKDLKGKLSKEERMSILDEINDQLELLQKQQQYMNKELSQQNKQLQHVDHKVDKQKVQMLKIQDTGQKILNKK